MKLDKETIDEIASYMLRTTSDHLYKQSSLKKSLNCQVFIPYEQRAEVVKKAEAVMKKEM
jgi:hypothetical protein